MTDEQTRCPECASDDPATCCRTDGMCPPPDTEKHWHGLGCCPDPFHSEPEEREARCTCDPDDATSRDYCAAHAGRPKPDVEGEGERRWTLKGRDTETLVEPNLPYGETRKVMWVGDLTREVERLKEENAQLRTEIQAGVDRKNALADELRAEHQRVLEAGYIAEQFILSVTAWEGDPEDQGETLDELRAALSPQEDKP